MYSHFVFANFCIPNCDKLQPNLYAPHEKKCLSSFFLFFLLQQMEHSIFGRCVFKNKMVIIPLYNDSTYMSLCSDICSRFDDLEVGAFEITYLVVDYPPSLLESDLDVRVMYLSLLNVKKNIVTIAIKECQLPNEVNSADDVFGSSTHATEGYNHIDENDCIGKYGAHADCACLSHTWRNCINHVGQKFIGGVHEFETSCANTPLRKGLRVCT
ncbi:unnamed protein product [Prunus armeniaca]